MEKKRKFILIGIPVLAIIIILLMLSIFCIKHARNEEHEQVKIGIIDSYIPANLLDNANISNISFINETDFSNKHGENILNIITNQSKNAQIYYSCVLDKNNSGTIENIAKSIEWCIEHKVNIICMSFATLDDNAVLRDAILKAQNNHVIIISSCINYSDELCYPAMYDGVISVSEGANKNATILTSNNIVKLNTRGNTNYLKGNSYTCAYICGYISKEIEKGNDDLKKIIKKLIKIQYTEPELVVS